jgi:PAS domain S-box-containing protein
MQYQQLKKEQLLEELQKQHKRVEVLEAEAGIRTQTVQALIESKENYRLLYETMAQGVVFQGATGEILSANPAAERLLGLSHDELLGKTSMDPCWHAVHADGAPFPGEEHPSMKALRTGNAVHDVIMGVYNTREDDYRWILVNAIPQFKPGASEPFQVYTTFSDISELKRTQKALAESEEKFRQIVQSSPMGIHLYRLEDDKRLVFTGANPAADRILGVDNVRFVGLSIEEAFPPLAETEIPEQYRQVCLNGRMWQTEQIEYRDEHIHGAYAVYAFQTTPRCMAALFLDITDRKRAEVALVESERKYRHLVTHAPTMIFEIDSQNQTFSSVNDVVCEYSGYSREEFMNLNPLDLLTEESRPLFIERNRRMLNGEDVSEDVEYKVRLKNGQERWILLNLKIMPDINGSIHTMVIAHDISERKRMEEALRESEEKYRLLIENARDAIFVAQDEVVKFPNPKTMEIIGYTEEELLHTPFVSIIHPEDRDMVIQRYKSRLQGEEPPSTYSFRVVAKHGREIWVQLNTVVITWEGRPATLNFLRDVTELRHLENQVQAAQRMESLGTLAGGIAHDFNNLLMGIQGRTSLMLERGDATEAMCRQLREIEEYVKSASDLTRQLLGLARGGTYEMKPSNLNRIVRKSVEMFGSTRKEIMIDMALQDDVWTVEADRGQIEQVLLNLLVNAWQAMPEGGNITIETENCELSSAFVHPHGVVPGKYVKVLVSDTGIGMDDLVRARVFDPFFTTKRRGRGTGLGLAAAYGIMKNHTGFITVASEKDVGSTFSIFLPVSDRDMADEKEPALGVVQGRGMVLLVDDEQVILEVGTELLKELGYDVLVCRSGAEAVEVFSENRKRISLVILDMIMPDMNGGETFDHIRNVESSAKVLLSSGYSLGGEAKDIMERGCNGFIQKPFNLEILSQKIHEIINQ